MYYSNGYIYGPGGEHLPGRVSIEPDDHAGTEVALITIAPDGTPPLQVAVPLTELAELIGPDAERELEEIAAARPAEPEAPDLPALRAIAEDRQAPLQARVDACGAIAAEQRFPLKTRQSAADARARLIRASL